jgi:hypothetical protein
MTAVNWLIENLLINGLIRLTKEEHGLYKELTGLAKQMEKEQRGYSKEDVLKAGEIGEINHHDYKHIVKLLDEARVINETYGK